MSKKFLEILKEGRAFAKILRLLEKQERCEIVPSWSGLLEIVWILWINYLDQIIRIKLSGSNYLDQIIWIKLSGSNCLDQIWIKSSFWIILNQTFNQNIQINFQGIKPYIKMFKLLCKESNLISKYSNNFARNQTWNQIIQIIARSQTTLFKNNSLYQLYCPGHFPPSNIQIWYWQP